jgi:heat-inducible transcriptional repressor
MDERKAAILEAVVERYVRGAQPVGSGQLASLGDFGVSSATIRNDMAFLESEGYLTHPHTSAGRVPTEKGYRYFVDRCNRSAVPAAGDLERVREFFGRAHREIEKLLHDTSKLLSDLTNQLAVVMAVRTVSHRTIRHVQLVALSQSAAVCVLVLDDGSVERRILEQAGPVDAQAVDLASRQLNALVLGRELSELPAVRAGIGSEIDLPLVDRALAAWCDPLPIDSGPTVIVQGASRLAASFQAVDDLRSVLGALEKEYLLVGAIWAMLDRGLEVAIGIEHGVRPLADCAMVMAPYRGGGEEGAVGIVGPTRMDYRAAMAAVGAVSEGLGEFLAEG